MTKILVVDDEQVVREGCRMVLESEGYEVALASSCAFALAAIRKCRPALLLLDLKMPGYDGLHLLRIVKKAWPDMAVVIMSGYGTPEALGDVFAQGADAFLPKPFTPDELLERVARSGERGPGCSRRDGLDPKEKRT